MNQLKLKVLENKLWLATDKMQGAIEKVIKQTELKYQDNEI